MRAKTVKESLNEFHQTGNPLGALQLGFISIELSVENLEINDNLEPIMTDIDTKYFIGTCEKNNIDWEVLDVETDNPGEPVFMRFSGTKDDLISLLVLFDAYGRDEKDLRRDLINWNGSEDQLLELIF